MYLHDPSVVDSAGDGYLRAGGAFKRFHGAPSASAGQPGDVFGACGAACMFRKDVFMDLGGFDEDFFMIYEDVDISYRARLRGYRCTYVPNAIVHHAGSGALGRNSPMSVYLGQRNLEWTYLKNTPWPLLIRSFPSHVLYDGAGLLAYAARGLLRTVPEGQMGRTQGHPGDSSQAVAGPERAAGLDAGSLAGDGRQLDSQETRGKAVRLQAVTASRGESLARSASTIISTSCLNSTFCCQPSTRLRFLRIADQVIDFGGPQELRIGLDVFLPVQSDAGKRDVHELAHRMADAGGDHVIIRPSAAAASATSR